MPSERWADCFVATPPDAHPEAGDYTIREKCMLYDRRIEVLDPGRARLLATAEVPRGLTATRRWRMRSLKWFASAAAPAVLLGA